MSAPPMSSGRLAWHRPGLSWIGDGVIAAGRGLVFCGLMLVGAALLAGFGVGAAFFLMTVAGMAFGNGLYGAVDSRVLVAIVVVPVALLGMRWVAGLTRQLAWQWCGVRIAFPYRSPGDRDLSLPRRIRRRLVMQLTDPATWRDLLWIAVDACGGWVLAAIPTVLVVVGLAWTGAPAMGLKFARSPISFLWFVPVGLALVALGLVSGPRLLRAYASLARSILGPTGQAELTSRVQHLARTRSDTIDAGAAEMRRIERDLHDGAQARLVAMGMTLDTAEQLMDSNPAAARALLAEARSTSAKALAELRDLVRGIHPPVLADRGLTDAVRALALDCPVRADLVADVPGRPTAPVESAAYFAISELLTNVAKHANATRVWIDIRHSAGMLRIGVTDDGRGGADPGRGTGLRGVERRAAAFDGVVAVSSPVGGPTMVSMEIPCELSLPKTSSS